MLFMAKGKEDVGKLEKFVMFQRGSGSITYKASVPVKGLFKLDIFGKDSRRHKSLDLICSYLIDSTSGGAKVNRLVYYHITFAVQLYMMELSSLY